MHDAQIKKFTQIYTDARMRKSDKFSTYIISTSFAVSKL